VDRILTVRDPFATALVHGLKKAEFRNWKIPADIKVWIHSAQAPGMHFDALPAWLRSLGDPVAADYLEWTDRSDDSPRPNISSSTIAQAIYDSKGLPGGFEFPFGNILGWCVFGESVPTTGEDVKLGKFANMVERLHALRPNEWRMHKGALGLMPFGGLK